MSRQTKWALVLGLAAYCLAWLGAGGGPLSRSRDARAHGPITVRESKMAKAEHVEAEPEAKINPLELKPAWRSGRWSSFVLLLVCS